MMRSSLKMMLPLMESIFLFFVISFLTLSYAEKSILLDSVQYRKSKFLTDDIQTRRRRQIEDEDLTVTVEQGLMEGQKFESYAGGSFIAFRGIPYARPPVGPLRFEDAQPPEPWEGIRKAHEDGKMCPQIEFNPVHVNGSEDCLYLNVYTPHMRSRLLPVMVYIHGGGFNIGNVYLDFLGPDYLCAEDVVVVTTQYRLGVFGFLYLKEAAPGNVGLKDQVHALRWVQKNIAAFGGNPDKVTIFGQSAGGASVHYQLLSPMSRGLYSAAIAESGNALDRWAQQTEPYETSQRLAKAVDCYNEDDYQTVKCLRGISHETLIMTQETKAAGQKDRNRLFSYEFVPTVDLKVPGRENFLPDDPLNIIREGKTNPVPFLTGINNNESLLLLSRRNFLNATVAKEIDESWNDLLVVDLSIPANCSSNEEAFHSVRDFYLNGKPLTNATVPGFMAMATDIAFGKELFYTLDEMTKTHTAPIYEYYFAVDDALNLFKVTSGYTDLKGAAHSDETGYLFHIMTLPEVPNDSSAGITRARMVRLWTNFAKRRNPTPRQDPLLNVEWKPYNNKKGQNYLRIGSHLAPGTHLKPLRKKFWKKFYETYVCAEEPEKMK